MVTEQPLEIVHPNTWSPCQCTFVFLSGKTHAHAAPLLGSVDFNLNLLSGTGITRAGQAEVCFDGVGAQVRRVSHNEQLRATVMGPGVSDSHHLCSLGGSNNKRDVIPN